MTTRFAEGANYWTTTGHRPSSKSAFLLELTSNV